METVYKVVLAKLKDPYDEKSEVYYSCFSPADHEIEYNVGYTAVPDLPGSYLYAFDTFENAKRYMKGMTGRDSLLAPQYVLRMFSALADVDHSVPPAYTMDSVHNFWSEHWYEFWNEYPLVLDCPDGTVMCRSIKLLDTEWTDGRTPQPKIKTQKKGLWK